MKLHKSSCTFFAATALALAGCGESDTTTYTNPVPDLLITIGQQERKASGAKGSADMSLKDATTKATMLSVGKVMGESSVAEANAQAILAAKGKVDSALAEANAALTALQEAKTEADALPADTPKLEELKAGLATAITEATRHRDAIKAIRDATGNDSLAKLVEKVTGANGKRTPADIAAAVAAEVEKKMIFPSALSGGVPLPPNAFMLAYDNVWWTRSTTPNLPELGLDRRQGIEGLSGVRLEQTDYSTYGYWLAVPAGKDSLSAVFLIGTSRHSQTASAASMQPNPSLGNTATYSGNALGMSILTEKGKAIKSGEFTADVNLTATFAGNDSTVKGTVSNFKGNAVDSDWSVDLKNAPLLRTGGSSLPLTAENYGLTRGKGAKKNAVWFAWATDVQRDWLPAERRPKEINGTFSAYFSNGRAGGGYAVVNDE